MKKGFIDNRMVKDSHQEGISRVMQRDRKKAEGYDGKMHGHTGSDKGFKRSGDSLTPRKA
jgi:hypothetical protein